MTHTTRTLIRQIQYKLKNQVTAQREFTNENAVIDFAVKQLYDDLKRKRLI